VRIKNRLVSREGGYTLKLPEREELFVYEAARRYMEEGIPLIVLAGKEYGAGSSRDWAAKGTYLLGIRAVMASSFERIHRSNLLGMGVLPLIFRNGDSWEALGLDGSEEFYIHGIRNITPHKVLRVRAVKGDGRAKEFDVIAGLDTEMEVEYLKHGGILPFVLRIMAEKD
jgi:aconitate hydratase